MPSPQLVSPLMSLIKFRTQAKSISEILIKPCPLPLMLPAVLMQVSPSLSIMFCAQGYTISE